MPVVSTDDGRLNLLIDTGATYNVLLRSAYRRERDLFGELGSAQFLIGMEGEPRDVYIASGNISIGGETVVTTFGVLDEARAMDTLRILTGVRIDGALGVEFLKEKHLAIDFTSMSVHSVD